VATSTTVCEACGAVNAVDATFCQVCQAFVGWDRTATIGAVIPEAATEAATPDAPADEASIETRVLPTVLAAIDHPTRQPIESSTVLDVQAEQDRVSVPISGASAEVALMITNRSDIVDGYEADVAGAPDWLRVESEALRLLPGTWERLVVRFRIEAATPVAAGELTIRLRVRSLTQSPAHRIVPLVVVVPVVDAPVQLRTEPSVVRIRDIDVARFVVVVDNSSANRPARVRLTGTDPELAVGFHFDPEVVTIGPGESTRVQVATTSRPPDPGTEITRSLSISATEGTGRVARTQLSLVHTASPSPMATLAVQLDPSVLRLGSGRHGSARVVVDNRRGHSAARVRLRGNDPENVVSFGFEPPELSVGPGQVLATRVRMSTPRPPGGREVNRSVTIEVTDGRTSVTTGGAIIQSIGDRRPWVRVVLTLLGAVAMIIGAMLPLRAVSARSSFAVNADAVAGLFDSQVDLVGLEQLVSFGLVIMVLAGLMAFGLTGRSGRLTRYAAVLAVLLTVALLVTIGVAGRDAAPGAGAIVIGLGVVLGYVGGLLARR